MKRLAYKNLLQISASFRSGSWKLSLAILCVLSLPANGQIPATPIIQPSSKKERTYIPFQNASNRFRPSSVTGAADWATRTGYQKIWVEWESVAPQRLTGRFILRGGGQIVDLMRLGTEGDELLSIQHSAQVIDLFPASPQTNGGFVFETDVTQASALIMELQGEQAPAGNVQSHSIPLATLTKNPSVFDLPGGLQIKIHRKPASTKLVYARKGKPTTIFSPGEEFSFEVLLDEIPTAPKIFARCEVKLNSSKTKELVYSSSQYAMTDVLGQFHGMKPFNFNMPIEEGGYDLEVEVSASRSRTVASSKKLISRRSVHLLVIDPDKPRLQKGAADEDGWDLLKDVELEKVAKSSEEDSATVSSRDGETSVIRSLRIVGAERGLPHIAELVCLASEQCRYNLKIKPSGSKVSECLVESEFEIDQHSERVSAYQFVFWPSDNEVTITVAQRGQISEKSGTRLRIYAGPADLPRVASPVIRGRRIVAAYVPSPVVDSRYGVVPARTKSGKGIGDWEFYFQSISRQTQLLNNSGYSAAMVTVAGHGGAIYPSEYIASSTLFDKGVYFPDGAGTPQKDILELMFRIYDREEMKLIPAIKFDFPLMSLENRMASGSALRMLNEKQEEWWVENPDWGAFGPYYNPAKLKVRMAIQEVVNEVVSRYGNHSSFGGIALVIDAQTYLQFPSERWGRDRKTLLEFDDHLHRLVDSQRNSKGKKREWESWRKDKLKGLLVDINTKLIQSERDQRLYVIDKVTKPSESHSLLKDEIETTARQHDLGIVWVSVAGSDNRLTSSRRTEFEQTATTDSLIVKNRLVKQEAVLVGAEALSNRAGSVRHKVMLSMGIAESDPDIIVHELSDESFTQSSVARRSIAAMQSLPVGTFQEVVSSKSKDRTVKVRTASSNKATYGYVLNNSNWPTRVHLVFAPVDNLSIESLASNQAKIGTDGGWAVRLLPYEVASFRIAKPNVRVLDWNLHRDASDTSKMLAWCGTVNERIQAAKALRLEASGLLTNGDFRSVDNRGGVLGWELGHGAGISIGRSESAGLSIRTEAPLGWPNAPIGWIRSPEFSFPKSGRLMFEAHVRALDDFSKTRVRMLVIGEIDGKKFEKAVWINGNSPVYTNSKDDTKYRTGQIRFEGLSVSESSKLQLVFEFHGGGQAWIEKVNAYERFFNDSEIAALESMHERSVAGIHDGDFSWCMLMKNAKLSARLLHDMPVLLSPIDAPSVAGETVEMMVGASGSAKKRETEKIELLESPGMIPERLLQVAPKTTPSPELDALPHELQAKPSFGKRVAGWLGVESQNSGRRPRASGTKSSSGSELRKSKIR